MHVTTTVFIDETGDAHLINLCLEFLRLDEIHLAWARSRVGVGFCTAAREHREKKLAEIQAIPATTDRAHVLKMHVALRACFETIDDAGADGFHEAAIYSIIKEFCASHPVPVQPAPADWEAALAVEQPALRRSIR